MMELLLVGSLGKARGLKGELYVMAYHPGSPLWRVGESLYVLPAGTEAPSAAGIVEAKPQFETKLMRVSQGAKGRLVIAVDGVNSREAAEALQNFPVAVAMDVLEAPEEGEFYYHEVAGWAVIGLDGQRVGRVVRAMRTYIDLLEVAPEGGGETFYVPVVGDIVKRIDREARELHIDLLEGLIP